MTEKGQLLHYFRSRSLGVDVGVSPQSPGTPHQAMPVMTLSPSYSPLIPNNTSLSSYLKRLFIVLIITGPILVVTKIYQLIMNHSMVITSVALMQPLTRIRWVKMAAATMS